MFKKSKKTEKEYTLAEIKEVYFPNIEWKYLRPDREVFLTKEMYNDVLEKVIPSRKEQH